MKDLHEECTSSSGNPPTNRFYLILKNGQQPWANTSEDTQTLTSLRKLLSLVVIRTWNWKYPWQPLHARRGGGGKADNTTVRLMPGNWILVASGGPGMWPPLRTMAWKCLKFHVFLHPSDAAHHGGKHS